MPLLDQRLAPNSFKYHNFNDTQGLTCCRPVDGEVVAGTGRLQGRHIWDGQAINDMVQGHSRQQHAADVNMELSSEANAPDFLPS